MSCNIRLKGYTNTRAWSNGGGMAGGSWPLKKREDLTNTRLIEFLFYTV